MIDRLMVDGLQYASYAAELVLVIVLLMRGRWANARAFTAYLVTYFAVDAILRPVVLYRFGYSSLQYEYVYWVTDVALTLGAFLLICIFFRRGSLIKREAWSHYRTMLGAVFAIITLISYFSLAHHYDHLFGRFIVDLQQNLYFACLVLTTVLYVLLQHWESEDEQLSLFVCGLGIGFAGPAAGMALMYLTPGGRIAGIAFNLVSPLCNLGMCLVWLYAVAQKETPGYILEARKSAPPERDQEGAPARAKAAARGR